MDQFAVDVRIYRDFSGVFDDMVFGLDKLSVIKLEEASKTVYNRVKTSEMEAYVILIIYRNMAKDV
jgi:hypothetical protein